MNQVIQEGTHQKYDKSLEDRMSMYDNQPYSKDPDLCSSDKIKLISGNVIKYYNFHYVANEPYVVKTQDEIVKEKLSMMQHELAMKAAKMNEEMNLEQDTPAEATVGDEIIS